MQVPIPESEAERTLVLERLGILSPDPEPAYDDAVIIAASLLQASNSYISLIGEARQWFRSKVGVRSADEPGRNSLSDIVLQTGETLLIENAKADPRFCDHPSVCGDSPLHFFVGVPIMLDGMPVGALCVQDNVAKVIDRNRLRAIEALGRQVSALLEQRLAAAKVVMSEFRITQTLERAYQANAVHYHAALRFETLFNGIPIACFTVDGSGEIQEWNLAAEQIFGIPAFQSIERSIFEVLSDGKASNRAKNSLQKSYDGEHVVEKQWRYRHPSGSLKRLSSNIFPLRNVKGIVVGAVVATTDISLRKQHEFALRESESKLRELNSQLEAANSQLAELAARDGLTGLYNQRAFMERLMEIAAFDRRENKPISLILIDVDRFKLINDTYGHPVGDQVLRELASVLLKNVRAGDFLARYGGEEFAIILPRTAEGTARKAAERIWKAVNIHKWCVGEVRISAGVATTNPNQDSPDSLVQWADEALYHSKQSGRNHITVYRLKHSDAA